MKVYRFRKPFGVAVTSDKSGNNLPDDGRRWLPDGEMEIEAADGLRIGASSADIVNGVEKHGFYVWPVAKTTD